MPLHVDSDEEVFHGKYIRVVKRHFRDMNQQPGIETVYRKTHGPIVAVVAVTPQHEVILNRIWRVPLGRYTIEFPAGLMDKAGEAPEACAARELLEETGYATGALTHHGRGVPTRGHEPHAHILPRSPAIDLRQAHDGRRSLVSPRRSAALRRHATERRIPLSHLRPELARDWSTSTDTGDEHTVTLHAWSRGKGRRETFSILGAIQAALHDQTLVLDGHRLINLRHDFSDARRDPDGETLHGIARFRAITEPL